MMLSPHNAGLSMESVAAMTAARDCVGHRRRLQAARRKHLANPEVLDPLTGGDPRAC